MPTKQIKLSPGEVEDHKEDVRRLRRARDLASKAMGSLEALEDATAGATAIRHLELFDEYCESKALEKIEAVRFAKMGNDTMKGAVPEGWKNGSRK